MNDRLGMRRRAVKRHQPMLLIAIIVFVFSGCTSLPIANDNATPVSSVTPVSNVKDKDVTDPTGLPAESEHSADEVVVIALGDTITVNGSGAIVNGSTVSIIASGRYNISGTLNNGQILVNTKDKNDVELILNGVNIASSASAPIYALDVNTMTIVLADGTENYVADGDSYIVEDLESNEPNAAIFSKGDLTIKGNGSLTVDAHYDNGIVSKDRLNIIGGSIIVNSVSDGIRGRDNIVIKDGNITVNAKADGMQSNNDEDPAMGFVSIEGGTINITAGEDGIQAETGVVISGGNTTISSGGGSSSSSRGNTMGDSGTRNNSQNSASPVSSKGIKGAVDVTIEGGTVKIDSADDSIHSNDRLTINDGNIVLASGDDGIHSDSTLTINGGDISITKSFEAIESAVITINGGNIRLVAREDGVNITGGNDRASVNGRPGRDAFNSSVDKHLKIEGGYVAIDAAGDGLDINGWVKITEGIVIVNGPIAHDDGALDYDREFTMAGGTLVAVGSSGIAQAPDATSTQYSLMLNLASPQPAGTLIHIEAEDGTGILTFAPIREYQSVVYSSSELKMGSTYNVYLGGSSTGSVVDGVYSGGSYTPGTRSAGFTISSIVTR